MGCCNGLLALRDSNDGTILILNPITDEKPIVPNIDSTSSNIVYGFGYDSKNADYNLVTLLRQSNKT
ncbi:unnamed protein product [Linum trigynum]|uniref:Uncharacterized protein n=1 Tax=Linum trigynum TaxID=586398 RepID=A0AAV2FGQ6_9ROSI